MTEAKEEPLAECLRLMKNDIGEAIAADELLHVIEHHINNLPDGQRRDLDPGFKYVVEALAWRMALAIGRSFSVVSILWTLVRYGTKRMKKNLRLGSC